MFLPGLLLTEPPRCSQIALLQVTVPWDLFQCHGKVRKVKAEQARTENVAAGKVIIKRISFLMQKPLAWQRLHLWERFFTIQSPTPLHQSAAKCTWKSSEFVLTDSIQCFLLCYSSTWQSWEGSPYFFLTFYCFSAQWEPADMKKKRFNHKICLSSFSFFFIFGMSGKRRRGSE